MKPNETPQKILKVPRLAGWGAVLTVLAAMILALCFEMHGDVRGRTARYPNLPQANVMLGHTTVKLWVAASARTRDRGLMFIHKMPNNCGMLFVFRRIRPQTFWMKHTLIPLDVIFLNQHGVIVRHYFMPPDNGKKRYPSGQPIHYAIELNAGEFQRLHLRDSMHISIPKRYSTPSRKATGAS